jgi:hypothetical protein
MLARENNRVYPASVPETELDEVEYLDARTRILNRAFLELFLIIAAVVGPVLILMTTSTGKNRMILHPVSGLVSAISVFLIALVSAPRIFRGIRGFRSKYLLEIMLAVAAGLLTAWGYLYLIRISEYSKFIIRYDEMAEQWGWSGLIFTVAIVPGIFEELAFRGVLQDRFDLVFGRKVSILYTGLAFALCHSVTLAFPIHLLLGLYLCSLRTRSRSLVPGMIVHTLYNTVVVFL